MYLLIIDPFKWQQRRGGGGGVFIPTPEEVCFNLETFHGDICFLFSEFGKSADVSVRRQSQLDVPYADKLVRVDSGSDSGEGKIHRDLDKTVDGISPWGI